MATQVRILPGPPRITRHPNRRAEGRFGASSANCRPTQPLRVRCHCRAQSMLRSLPGRTGARDSWSKPVIATGRVSDRLDSDLRFRSAGRRPKLRGSGLAILRFRTVPAAGGEPRTGRSAPRLPWSRANRSGPTRRPVEGFAPGTGTAAASDRPRAGSGRWRWGA